MPDGSEIKVNLQVDGKELTVYVHSSFYETSKRGRCKYCSKSSKFKASVVIDSIYNEYSGQVNKRTVMFNKTKLAIEKMMLNGVSFCGRDACIDKHFAARKE